MFVAFALVSLLFAGVMAWLLYDAFRTDRPVGWLDWGRDLFLAVGSLATIATALKVLVS